MADTLFFDTYAIIEILGKNPSYAQFTHYRMILTKLNLFELYYTLLRSDSRAATKWLHACAPFAIAYSTEDIVAAARLKRTAKKLSMADCIGYAVAQRLEVEFLTGDKEFEHRPGVRFVK